MFTYKPTGTCSKNMLIDAEDGVIRSVTITDGCKGGTQALASLLVGMRVDEAIARLKGIECRNGTSCPDQLACALESMKSEGENRKD